jgi:hypothetical protein
MSEPANPSVKILANVAGVLGVLTIMAGLIWAMYYYTQPPVVDQARWAERKRNFNELSAQNRDLLDNYAYVDKAKGTVRLSLERALELTAKEWQNPAAARAAMLAYLDKYVPTPPPVAATNPPAVAPAK